MLELQKLSQHEYTPKEALFNYYIVYANTGVSSIGSLRITDTIPAELDYRGSSGAYNGSIVLWDIGTLGPGEHGTLTMQVFAPAASEGAHVENSVYGTYLALADGLPRAPVVAQNELWVLTEPAFHISRNIFNPGMQESVRITWKVAARERMFLGIYNTAGEMVRLLKRRGEYKGYSMGEVEWDGRNEAGDLVASGVYIIYLEGSRAYYGKVVVVK